MPNLFVNIPVPSSNAVGAAVDVSAMGKTKSIIVGGDIDATVTIECANDLAGIAFAPIASFQGGGNVTVDVAARWLRARTDGYKSGAANADVGASDAGTSFAQLVAPAGDGDGAAVAIGTLPEFKTVVVSGGFTGALNIEVSEDGVDYAQAMTFHGGGSGSAIVYGAWARVSREGASTGPVPTVWMGGASAAGGGGASSGPWQRIGAVISEVVPTDQVVVGSLVPAGLAPFSVFQGANRLLAVDQNLLVGDPANPTGSMMFINQSGAFISNAGIQHSSDFANRAGYRANQFGANAGIPGVVGFKSRGAIGTLVSVLAGDVLWRATAIGVAPDNASIPLAGSVSINAATPLPPAGNYVPTDFEVALVSLAGPINSRRPVFVVDSEGVLHVKEGANAMAGVAVTGAGGTIVVPNTRITANTRILLTAQDGGAVPTNGMHVSARVIGVNFTIQMISAGDVGVLVYYQLYEPIP